MREGETSRTAAAGGATTDGSQDWDLLVVGGGSAGFAAAIAAAELGRRVGLVNTGPLGGTCTNRGCVPSKALIRAAEAWWRADHHPFAGIRTAQVALDWHQVRAQKDALVGQLRQRKYADVLDAYPGITLVDGQAAFQPDGSLLVGKRTLRAERYVVAVGGRPRIVPLPGIDAAEPLTSTSLMELDKLPASLLVLGGRAVALELGQMMARLGVEVTILQRSDRLVPDHEPEIGDAIANYLRDEGITLVTSATVDRLDRVGDTRVIRGRVAGQLHVWQADQVLIALGRRANTNGLGLESVGVKLTPEGAITVDEFLQTTNPAVYAAGDAAPIPEYVYVAAASGTLAAQNALGLEPAPLDLSVVPGVIFTDPQIASVGLTDAQAQAAGHAVRSATIDMNKVHRAQVAHDLRGLVKLVADEATGRLLGAHIVTADGGEVVASATLAVKHRLTVDDLVGTLFPYLTYAEALRLAAVSFDKDLDKLSCCV